MPAKAGIQCPRDGDKLSLHRRTLVIAGDRPPARCGITSASATMCCGACGSAKGGDMTRLLIAVLVVFASLPAQAQDDVAAFYKGKVVRLDRRHRRRLGLRHQRPAARPLPAEIHSRQSDRHRAEPARRRLAHHDQPALRRRARSTAPRSAPRSTGCRPRRCCNRPARASRRSSSTGSAAPTARPRRCTSGTPRRSRRSTTSRPRR